MRTITLTGIIAVAIFAASTTCLVAATSLEDLIEALRCTCGCNMVLSDCACRTAKDMINQIRQKIVDGKSGDQIVADFRAVYGDVILVTPPKSGLELILWLLPIIASAMGTMVIYEYARGKAPFPTSEIRAPIAEVDVKVDREQIEAEMAKYEEMFYEEYKKFKEEEE